jgi:hypothetical protein
VRLGIVEPKRLALQVVAGGVPDLELLEVGVGVEQLVMVRNAVVFDPFGRADQPVGQAAEPATVPD